MKKKLINKIKSRGNPLLKGDQATFVWPGKSPPELIGDFNDWGEKEGVSWVQRKPGLWTATLNFAPETYVEYTYVKKGKTVRDRYNPNTITNGLGAENHYFYMPEGKSVSWIKHKKKIPHGAVRRYKVDTEETAIGETRNVYLYAPPTDQPCPLLVVWDGKDYLEQARLPDQVDNLIAFERIQPLAMALVENGGAGREIEYSCNEATLAFLTEKVLPLARENLDLLPVDRFPGSYGVLGASMGGLMALYAGMRLPQVFGSVMSQSGAFNYYSEDSLIFDLVRLSEPRPIKIWMDVGQFEDLVSTNRSMLALLLSKGYTATLREFPGGHNYTSWRNDVWRGLEYLFGA